MPPTLVVDGGGAAAGTAAGAAAGAAGAAAGAAEGAAGAAAGAPAASGVKSLNAATLASSSTITAMGVLMATSCALREWKGARADEWKRILVAESMGASAAGAPFRHQDLGDHAVVDRLIVHGGLIGLDLGQHIPGAEAISDLQLPGCKVSCSHRGRERRHRQKRVRRQCAQPPHARQQSPCDGGPSPRADEKRAAHRPRCTGTSAPIQADAGPCKRGVRGATERRTYIHTRGSMNPSCPMPTVCPCPRSVRGFRLKDATQNC